MSDQTIMGVDEVGRGCERPDAEVLTRHAGWKHYSDLSLNDEILSYTKDGEMVWQNIDKILEFDYEGPLIELKNRRIHVVVSPEHKFDVLRRLSQRLDNVTEIVCGYKVETISVQDLKPNDAIPRVGKWSGKSQEYFVIPGIARTGRNTRSYEDPRFIPIDLWVSFMGIFLSEGSTIKEHKGSYKVHIAQTKFEGREKIQKLLNELPFSFSPNSNGFVCHDKALWEYLRPLGKCHEKYIPSELKDLSSDLLNLFIDWLILGDGNVYQPPGSRQLTKRYYTVSERLKDDFEEIALKAGWAFTTRTRPGKGYIIKGRTGFSNAQCFEINLRRSVMSSCKSLKPTILPYKGKVFCLSLPFIHNFFVRRNGRGYFTGNSLAGPVFAAAVSLPKAEEHQPWILQIRDSKKLSEKKRAYLADLIFANSVWYIEQAWPQEIDEINILNATLAAMGRAVDAVSTIQPPDLVLVDGNMPIPDLPYPQESIKGGDDIVKSIGAASIIAKVTRDNLMKVLHSVYPEYGWDRNKGYGTKEHREAIMVHGITELHRLSFKGVAEYARRFSGQGFGLHPP